mgnify:CR=1 FL=1
MAKKGTILLQSGHLDKALTAFILASGFAALGVEMKMWFMIWGHNCLKRRRSFFSPRRRPDAANDGTYRDLATDTIRQPMVEMLTRGGADHLPLSQLNLLGLGPAIFSAIASKPDTASVGQFNKFAHAHPVSSAHLSQRISTTSFEHCDKESIGTV